MQKPLLQILTLLTLCVLITLPNLTTQGLTNSEAHRVIPALEMLNTGDLLVPTMFDQPYLRKPQLTPWLFAAALKIHNDPTLTPRLVSALCFTLTVLCSFFFARRWFGHNSTDSTTSAGFPAALALTLTPLYWSPARAAEIESLNNLLTAIAAFLALDLIINTAKPFKNKLPTTTLLTITALAMLLTKGPAGFPILLALILSSAILTRSIKAFFNLHILLPVALAAALFAWFWSITLTAAGPTAITQSPNAFMFEQDKLLKLAAFIPVSLLTALPITLALLFPWGKDAKTEASQSDQLQQQLQQQLHTAKLLALSIPLALLIMNLTGVSNDRYAQPILITATPLIGWLLTIHYKGTLQPHRQKILNTLTLGSPKILATILAALAILYIAKFEPHKRATSGKQPALQLAADLQSNLPPAHYTLVADAMIEARPETLLYLQRALKNTDHQLTVLWIPNLTPERLTNLYATSPTPQPPLLALIRTDTTSTEPDKVLVNKTIATGTVHKFDFALVTLNLE